MAIAGGEERPKVSEREHWREKSKVKRSRSSNSARALSRARRPESTRTRTLCQAWVAARALSSKLVMAAADSRAPDSSRLSRRRPAQLAWPCLGSPESVRALSWVTVTVT